MQNPGINLKIPKSNNFRTKSGKSNIYKNANIGQRTSINRNNNNCKRYQSAKNKNKNNFDIRMVLCLKMLGIGYLQKIFETKNITFDELLILSMKDLANLGIKKEEQIIIKKFSLDYIKNGSYFTLDELDKFFNINKNKYKNYRTINSVKDLNGISQNIQSKINNINNKNNLRNNINYKNIDGTKNICSFHNINNMKNTNNYDHKRCNSYSNKEYYNTLNYVDNTDYYLNNNININQFSKRNNSANVRKINNQNINNSNHRNYNLRNKLNHNLINNINSNNIKRKKIAANLLDINGISNSNSIISYYTNNNFLNSGYITTSSVKSNTSNLNIQNYNNRNNNSIEINKYYTGDRNGRRNSNNKLCSQQNKKSKQLKDLEKNKINNILTNKISSFKKKNFNVNAFFEKNNMKMNNMNNINNNNELNEFSNEKEFNMFLQMGKMKKNNLLENNNNFNNTNNFNNINNYTN